MIDRFLPVTPPVNCGRVVRQFLVRSMAIELNVPHDDVTDAGDTVLKKPVQSSMIFVRWDKDF